MFYTLWSGDVLKPSSFVTAVDILLKIRGELAERYDFIANWLYCLRDKSRATTLRSEAGTGASHKDGDNLDESPGTRSAKRRRLDGDDSTPSPAVQMTKGSASDQQRAVLQPEFLFQLDTTTDPFSRIQAWISKV